MGDYPFLSLSRVTVDPAVVRQLPRRLAFYYLALPLARDDDQLTLVMAHPDNQAAVAVLQAVLGERIVPIQGSAREIRAALDTVWSAEAGSEALHILCWSGDQERLTLVLEIANLVARAFEAQVTTLDASQSSLDTVLTVARQGQYGLTVVDAPQGDRLSHLLRESSTPVLLVRGAGLALRHILLVLRGHSPDESVLDRVIPLAHANSALVTLLTVAPTAAAVRSHPRSPRMPYGLAALLTPDEGPGEHIATCVRRLTQAGIQGDLRLRQGMLEHQIGAEVAGGSYDLITIAAEAHGDVVQRILGEIQRQAPDNQQPVLVIKPITE